MVVRSARVARVLVRRIGVHRVAALVGLIQRPALWVIGLLLGWVPRSQRLVVMGSPLDRFADNAAYLYLHLCEHASHLEVVWVTGSPGVVRRLRALGYRAELRWSWSGVVTALRSGTFVYSGYRSDINKWLAHGARAVALWHGLPIKQVEAGVADAPRTLLTRLTSAGRERPADFLLSSSEFVTRCFSPWFGVPSGRCWELGYPRCDHLVSHPAEPPRALVADAGEWQELRDARLVVGLFLTWRDDQVDDAVDDQLFRRLVETCRRHDALVAYKAHYNVAARAAPLRCVILPPEADLHAYLGLCDVLVTDYSSIALDFLLMRRPVVYFMPDVEEYAATRGFAVDPLALPGYVTRDLDCLASTLDAVLEQPDDWTPTPADEEFLAEMWGDYDGAACPAIAGVLEAALSGRLLTDEVEASRATTVS